MTPLDIAALTESWHLHLRAERKSPQTIRSYLTGLRLFGAFCEAEGLPFELDKPTARLWVATLLDEGAEASTAVARLLAIRRFSAWLADEGETDEDRLLGIKPPKIDEKVTPRLTDEECARLIKACAGREFRDRRDEAVIRFALETTARAGEIVAMTLSELDLKEGKALIRRGKGGKGRVVPVGAQTALALDRYTRARRAHRLADTDVLWLGDNGQTFGYFGLRGALRRRAEGAGIDDFHPHLLRHTAAQRWRAAGGSWEGLQAVGGWGDARSMSRYLKATASDRAIAESRGLNLGDF